MPKHGSGRRSRSSGSGGSGSGGRRRRGEKGGVSDKLINHWKNRRDEDAPYEKGTTTTEKEQTETENGEIEEEKDDNKNNDRRGGERRRSGRERRGGQEQRDYNNNEQHYQHRHQESGYDRNEDRGPPSKNERHAYKQARFGSGLERNRKSNDQQLALQPCTTFDAMKLKPDLLKGIYAYGFEKPSAIQQRAIKPIVLGRDVIAQSQSGTGKTAVFCIGSLQLLDPSKVCRAVQVVVLSPTRELAEQSQRVMQSLGDFMNVRSVT